MWTIVLDMLEWICALQKWNSRGKEIWGWNKFRTKQMLRKKMGRKTDQDFWESRRSYGFKYQFFPTSVLYSKQEILLGPWWVLIN